MRPEILNPLFAEVEALKGVGSALAKPLGRLGLTRIVDMLFHLPVTWIDRKTIDVVDMSDVGAIVTVPLTPVDYRPSSGRGPFRVIAQDGAGNMVTLAYFGGNAGWARKLLPIGEPRIVSGKLDAYGQELQMVHPDHVLPLGEALDLPAREAVYGLSEGLTNKRMGQLAGQALERAPELPEWIEPRLLAQRGWPGWREALRRVHVDPVDGSARDRLAYDEVLANQLALALVRASTRRRRGRPLAGDGRLRAMLDLPYAPTGAQARTFNEIAGDLAQATPMVRLLQGDVGSGKTLVATLSLLVAVEAGVQGALLAPTELLARQHYETLRKMLGAMPVNIAILTGREKGRAREATLMALADGSIDILIGTHAIFQEAVAYKSLGLVVVDEQHRFGVAQRMLLTSKAERPPHLLVMTATPIPRTLTLTHYGEMDVSRLDEMPPGRTPVETSVLSAERLEEVVAGLGRHIDKGGQAYWVCPLVEESEQSDLAAAEERAAALRLRFGEKIGLVHGRMKGPEKDAAMAAFAAGHTAVLVATTVIEVGVDVPNASLIVIEHAEQFGLAQLHQLRGRVGRGSARSVCLLMWGGSRVDGMPGRSLGETAKARLMTMKSSTDGFFLAEEDLRLRGAGEMLGLRQSGEAALRLASPEQLSEMVDVARDDARLLIERDGGLAGKRGQAAQVLLYLFERDAAVGLLRAG